MSTECHTISGKTRLMGIINLTDNSFVASSRLSGKDIDAVVRQAGKLLEDGADILDIGACSTAPGNSPVSEEIEWARLEAPLAALFEAYASTAFSIDTFRPGIVKKIAEMRRAFPEQSGRAEIIINDVRAALMDRRMLSAVADNHFGYVAVDSSENPADFFLKFSLCAQEYSIARWIADPGFGFGKSIDRNWEILRSLGALKQCAGELLVALSRKRMIYMPLGLTAEGCGKASVEAEMLSIRQGADIVRTHDVAALKKLLHEKQ